MPTPSAAHSGTGNIAVGRQEAGQEPLGAEPQVGPMWDYRGCTGGQRVLGQVPGVMAVWGACLPGMLPCAERVSRGTRRSHGVPSWGGAVPRPRRQSTV